VQTGILNISLNLFSNSGGGLADLRGENICRTGLNLIRARADLAVLSTGIPHGKNPERMALAAGTFGTARGVMESALEQRSAKDVPGGGKMGGELFSFADGLRACHQQ
jgi:hypothetical protein